MATGHRTSGASFIDGDRRLLALVDAAVGEAAAASGAHLACRAGCTPCCYGPFPITQLDAWRLREGLRALEYTNPTRALAIRARASEDVATQRDAFPGDQDGTFHGDEAAEESFCARYHDVPCPALDPDTGTCDLYAWRPIACRTFGPPMRTKDEDVPPCGLCFTEATPQEVDAARRRLDVEADEAELTTQLEEDSGRFGYTTVACVLSE